MKMKKTTNKSSNVFRSISTIGILLATFTQIPCVGAGEKTVGSQDVLQASIMRNQASVNQQLSVIRDEMILKNHDYVSSRLLRDTERTMHEIALANEENRLQQEELMNAIRVYLHPAGVNADAVGDLAGNTVDLHGKMTQHLH